MNLNIDELYLLSGILAGIIDFNMNAEILDGKELNRIIKLHDKLCKTINKLEKEQK